MTETTPMEQPAQMTGPLRWSHHSTPNLDAAMAQAQGEMRAAKENARNSHLKSSYADMKSVIQAVRGPLSRAGIARYQPTWTRQSDGALMVTTRIAHSGEWVEADFVCRIEEQKGLKMIQSVGNVITYVKRYSLSAILGVATGEDDDGESDVPHAHPLEAKWAQAIEAFGALGVNERTLLHLVQRDSGKMVTEADHTKLGALYQDLRNGDADAIAHVEQARGG